MILIDSKATNTIERNIMAASQYDFSIEQGSSFKLSLVYNDTNGNPMNLSGYCSRLNWLTDDSATQSFLTTNTDFSQYSFTITAPSGNIVLQIPASITNTYSFSTAKYDLEIESPTNIYASGGHQVTRLLYGDITIIKRFSESSSLLDC